MSRRILNLPIRALSSRSSPSASTQWVCRRCLSTQQPSSLPSATDLPLDAPLQSKPTNPAVSSSRADTSDSTSPIDPWDLLGPTNKLLVQRNPSLKTIAEIKTLRKTLRKGLPQNINAQYLYHVPSELLTEEERAVVESSAKPKKEIVGVVVGTGKMDRTVRVKVAEQRWEARVRKYYSDYVTHLVHDPNNSLVEGDVIALHRLHVSANVFHVVASIVTPFGQPVEARAPIPSPEQRLAAYKEKRFKKLERQGLRRKAAEGNREALVTLRQMGLVEAEVEESEKEATAAATATAGKKRAVQQGKGGKSAAKKA